MNVVVDVFVVKQVKKSSEFLDWKGNTDFDPEYISNLQIFGQSDIEYVSVSLPPCLCPFMLTEFNHILPSLINVTIILGEFTLDDEAKAPKLLLLCSSGMLCNEVFTKPHRDAFAIISTIMLDPYQAEEGLKSEGLVGCQAKSATRQTRIH